MNICLKILSLVILWGAGQFLLSCKKEALMTTAKLPLVIKEDTAATGQLQLSVSIANDMEIALMKSGLTPKEAATIKAGALQGLSQNGLSLQGNQQDLLTVAPAIMGGAIRAMSDERAGLGNPESKLKISGVLASAMFQSLGDKMDGLSPEARESIPGQVVKSAVQNLESAGLDGQNLSEGIGAIVESSVQNLNEAGYQPQELEGVVTKLTKSTVDGMKSTKMKSSAIGGAMQKLVSKAVSSLDEAGAKPENIGGMVGPVMAEAIGGLDDLGVNGSSQMQNIVGSLMATAVSSFKSAGVEGDQDISKVLNHCVKGAMNGIQHAGVKTENLSLFVDDMMKGAVSSLDDIGVKDAASIQNVAGNMSADAISFLDDFGVKDKDAIKLASEAVAVGTMAALGALKNEGILDQKEVEAASSKVSEKAVDAILKQAEKQGLVGDITDMASGFSTGMVAGLSEAGWNAADISLVSDDIGAGFKDALRDEPAVDQAAIDGMASVIQKNAASWISDMKIHCTREKGIWHADGGWCEHPISSPAPGGASVSQEDESKCFENGGSIKYRVDGSWFCDIEAGDEAFANAIDCETQGYSWVKGPDGEYCEPTEPPSACWLNIEQAECLGEAAGCAWVGDYCESVELVTCQSYEGEAMCDQGDSCHWEALTASCENDVCAETPNAPGCEDPVETAGGQPTGPTEAGALTFGGEPEEFSDETLLGITIGGPGVVAYKYKLGPAPMDCLNSGGYGAEHLVTQLIDDDIAAIPDGDIDLCVVGKDSSDRWHEFTAASILVISWVKDTTDPDAPQAVTIVDGSPHFENEIDITYVDGDDDEEFDTHIIKACTDMACTTGCVGLIEDESSGSTIAGLVDGQTYYACVQSEDMAGNTSAFVASATPVTIDTDAPDAPGAVDITTTSPTTGSSLAVNFNVGVDPNLATHNLKACTNTGCSNECVGDTTSMTSPGTINSLVALKTYYACVQAEDSAGNKSPWVASSDTIDTIQVAPPEISGLTYTVDSSTQVTLSWSSGGGSTSDYRIAYTTGATAPATCASGIQISEGAITGVSHSITSLNHQTQYSFRVCAINGNPTPDVSSGLTATAVTPQTLPPNVTGLAGTDHEGTSSTLSWTSGGGSTADYRISYQTGGTAPIDCSSGTAISEGAITGTSHQITGLTSANTYSFRVCAINSDGTPGVASGSVVTVNLKAWEFEVTTSGAGETMGIGFDNAVNVIVDWGDGNLETVNSGGVNTDSTSTVTHVYTTAGTYNISIRGQTTRVNFYNSYAQTRLTKILSVVQGISGLTSFRYTFKNVTSLTGSIPTGLFDSAPAVTTFSGVFDGASGLTGNIPSGLFDYNTSAQDFSNAFMGASSLTGPIPTGLFANNTSATSFSNTFNSSSGLTSIPTGLFDNNTSVTHFSNVFAYTSGMTSAIPAGLFDNNTAVTSLSGIFMGSSVTGSIPSGLFNNNTAVTDMSYLFQGATGLTGSIPTGLFNNNVNVTSFYSTFSGTSGLSGNIPTGLFDNNTSATSFSMTFYGTTGITGAIPGGLFNNNTGVTTFHGTFWNSGVTGNIPPGLFSNNTAVTLFSRTFSGAGGLSGAIPAGLFDNNTLATNFSYTFSNTGLTGGIPAGLFDYATGVTTFKGTFFSATNLTSVPGALFSPHSSVTDFTSTFKGATGLSGAVPTLWTTHSSVPNRTDCFDGVTGASNYGSIPADWK